MVKRFRDQAIFWHNLWKDCGRPDNSWVADIRRFTRFNYHEAVRKMKRNQDRLKREKVADKLRYGSPAQFWNVINAIHTEPVIMSSEIDGKTGIDTCNISKEKYKMVQVKVKFLIKCAIK